MNARTKHLLQLANWVIVEARKAIPYSSNRTAYENILQDDTPYDYLKLLQDLLRADIKKSGSEDKAIVNEIRRKVGIEFLSDDTLRDGLDVLFPLTIHSWGRKFDSLKELYRTVKKRFTKHMCNKPNRTDLEYVEAQAIRALINRIGNCGETSAYALLLLIEYPSVSANDRPPLPDVPIKVERLQYKKPGDHAFVVLDRTAGVVGNIATWNDDAVICDPWVGISYTVADWKHWQKFPKERPNYIIDKQYELELTDPFIRAKKPYAFLGEKYNELNRISVHSPKWERKHKKTDKSFRPLRLVSSSIQSDLKNIRALYQAAKNGDIDYIKQHVTSTSLRINHRALIELAVENGHVAVTEFLLGSSFFQVKNYLSELINLAVANSQLGIFEMLCSKDPAFGKLDSHRLGVFLLIAVANGHLDVMHYFEKQYGDLVDMHLQQRGVEWLQQAAINGQIEMIKYLMQKSPKLGSVSNKEQLLLLAAKNNHRHLVEFLIESGVNPGVTDQSKQTVPYIAAQAGCLDVVLYYMEIAHTKDYRIDFGETDKYGDTLLHVIAKDKDLQFKQVEKIFNVAYKIHDKKNHVGDTPFTLAVRNNNDQLIRLLLGRAVSLDCVKRMSPIETHNLFSAVLSINDEKTKLSRLIALYKNGLNLESKDEQNNTLLHAAVRANDVVAVKFLLEHFAEENAINSDGDTPLHLAVDEGNKKITNELLLAGADFNCFNHKNETPFSMAIEDEEMKILAAFIDDEDKLKKVTALMLTEQKGEKLIELAILYNTHQVIYYVLDNIIDVEAKKRLSEHAFMLAVKADKIKLVKKLLQRGVDINANDATGNTALHIAALEDHEDMLRFLKRTDAISFSKKNNNGETALMLAVRNKQTLASDYLLKYSEDVNELSEMTVSELWFLLKSAELTLLKEKTLNKVMAVYQNMVTIRNPDEKNETVLHYAARSGSFLLIESLLEKGADIHARDAELKTPLYRAAERDHQSSYIIMMLLDRGATIQHDETYSEKALLALLKAIGAGGAQYHDVVVAILKQAVKMGYASIVSNMFDSGAFASLSQPETSGLRQHSLLAQSRPPDVSLQQELPRLLPELVKIAEDNHQPDIAYYLRGKAMVMSFKLT